MLTWGKVIVLIISILGICSCIMTCDVIIIKEIKKLRKSIKFVLEEIEDYRNDVKEESKT